ELTRMILVTRPRTSSLKEAARTQQELAAIGIRNQHLVINAMMPEDALGDPLAVSMIQREATALAAMAEELAALSQTRFYLRPESLVGLDALRRMNQPLESMHSTRAHEAMVDLPPLSRLVDEIEADGKGLVMSMGKGGVGKTSIAAA